MSSREFEAKRVLVTGATGYVGGRLVQELLSRGFTVRVLVRQADRVADRSWLQFEAIPEGDRTRLVQTAYFAPTGFLGWLYWYGIYVVHALIFSGLISVIARDVEHGLP